MGCIGESYRKTGVLSGLVDMYCPQEEYGNELHLYEQAAELFKQCRHTTKDATFASE